MPFALVELPRRREVDGRCVGLCTARARLLVVGGGFECSTRRLVSLVSIVTFVWGRLDGRELLGRVCSFASGAVDIRTLED